MAHQDNCISADEYRVYFTFSASSSASCNNSLFNRIIPFNQDVTFFKIHYPYICSAAQVIQALAGVIYYQICFNRAVNRSFKQECALLYCSRIQRPLYIHSVITDQVSLLIGSPIPFSKIWTIRFRLKRH